MMLMALAYISPSTAAPGPEGQKKTQGRAAWIVQTGIPAGMDNPVKVLVGKKIEMLTLSNRVAAGPVKIPQDGLIRLVKEVPHPENKQEVVYRNLAKAAVPDGVRRALVIMIPRREPAADGSLFVTRVQPLSTFKGGDFMYINLTNTRIGIEIAGDKLLLKSGGMKIHDVKGSQKLVSVPYRYSYYQAKKRRWMPVSASMTILSQKRREVFIFSVSRKTGRIRCRGVTVSVDM